jgi:hypothetical protein
MPPIFDWKQFESYVEFIYLNLKTVNEPGFLVEKNKKVIGKSGAEHQFDLYYEFQKFDLAHSIAWLLSVNIAIGRLRKAK